MTGTFVGVGEWRYLGGMAFGLQQPCVIGELAVGDVGAAGLDRIVQALAGVVDEPCPAFGAAEPAAMRGARLWAFAYGAVQRAHRIAVSEACHLCELAAAPTGETRFEVALPYVRRPASVAALRWVAAVFHGALDGTLDAALARQTAADSLKSTEAAGNRFQVLRSAQRLGIPCHAWGEQFVVFGTGHYSRWANNFISDRTSSISVTLAKRKSQTAALLRRVGLPGSDNAVVQSREEAVEAARRLGLPVVVKPDERGKGRGVARALRDESAVGAAYDAAAAVSRQVLVERWFAGTTYRLNVLNGRVNGVTRRDNHTELDPGDPACVHPDNARLAADAAAILQLDVASVDLVIEDIGRSWLLEAGALVCEVDAQPQVLRPSAIDEMLRDWVGGGDGRIHAELFVWPEDAALREAQVLSLAQSGAFDAVSHAAGICMPGGVRATAAFADGMAAGRALLMRTDVGRAACVMTPREIVTCGLPLDRWQAVHIASEPLFAPDEGALLEIARQFAAVPT
ncbi:MAG: hypothetical protein HY854_03835 [Burkholderiales bacterium]|nr:hypothetical protein [Burkholderiales bacterium]